MGTLDKAFPFLFQMKILANDFPLFPLNSVLFPQARIPLYIFEPRYREMINRCIDDDLAFGVVLIKEGSEVGASATPHAVGTLARILDVVRAADGTLNISAMGLTRFRILEHFATRPYLTGRIEVIPEENVDLKKIELTARRTESAFKEYVKKIQTISEFELEDSKLSLPKDPAHLAYLIAANMPLSNSDRQSLLEARSVKDCLSRETLFLERELNLLRLVTETSDRTRDQGSFSLN
jgi:uncharacterized protein